MRRVDLYNNIAFYHVILHIITVNNFYLLRIGNCNSTENRLL